MFELRNCNEEEKTRLVKQDVDPKDIKTLNYFGRNIYFYDVSEVKVAHHDYWVNYTGLRSERPKVLLDILQGMGVISDGSKVLDLGCGLSEMGIEINRRFTDITYLGVDVNRRLLEINRANFGPQGESYQFKSFDFATSNPEEIRGNYDVVLAMGCADAFFKIFPYISKSLKPAYIVCETHVGRDHNLREIAEVCDGYSIKTTEEYSFTSVNGPSNPNFIGYKRRAYILVRSC